MKEENRKLTPEEIEYFENVIEERKRENGIEVFGIFERKKTEKKQDKKLSTYQKTKKEIERELFEMKEIEMVKLGMREYLDFRYNNSKNRNEYYNDIDLIFNRYYTLKNNLKQ